MSRKNARQRGHTSPRSAARPAAGTTMAARLMPLGALAAGFGLASSALAQTAAPAPAAAASAPAANAPAMQKPVVKADGQLASNLVGETVYNGTGENAENIGDVNDLVIGPNGAVEELVVGVGGFLGMGEKDVAVDYKTAEWAEKNGDRWLVVAMSKEELEAAPTFDRMPYEPAAPVAAKSRITARPRRMVATGRRMKIAETFTSSPPAAPVPACPGPPRSPWPRRAGAVLSRFCRSAKVFFNPQFLECYQQFADAFPRFVRF